jgi:ATP-dependent Clp protease ATP-binding subunit ClpC
MFERYTEKARRVIFFARYEASALGSAYIESEHLLLGLMRESKSLFDPPCFPLGSRDVLRKRIEDHAPKLPPTTTSVDLPLASDAKRILAYAAEEAQALSHLHIGTEHILLGILKEREGFAAKLLAEYGLTADNYHLKLKEAEKSDDGPAQRGSQPARPPFLGSSAAASLLPLSAEGLRVLAFAIEEAEALGQRKIGTEHLLLGILRRENSFSANLLQAKGVDAEAIRQELRRVGKDEGAD